MAVVERLIFTVRAGKWGELWELEGRYDEVEGCHGFPPKRRYQLLFGGGDVDTYVVEREWDSLAALEGAQDRGWGDPDWEALRGAYGAVFEDERRELYTLLEPPPDGTA